MTAYIFLQVNNELPCVPPQAYLLTLLHLLILLHLHHQTIHLVSFLTLLGVTLSLVVPSFAIIIIVAASGVFTLLVILILIGIALCLCYTKIKKQGIIIVP